MRALPDTEVFSRAEARQLGWSDPAFSRAVRAGRIVRLRRDQFTVPTASGRCPAIAAARACRGSVVSHRSAALFWGLPVVGALPVRPEITVAPSGTGDVAGAALHRATLAPRDIATIDGVRVTSVARTIVDLGRHRPAAAAVAAADKALHESMVTMGEIQDVLLACRNWPRITRARRALRLVDARSESPLESVSRLTLGWLRIPTPRLQQRIADERGLVVARADFYWDGYGVLGEADGRGKYDGRDVLTAEKERQERAEELGLVVVRWGWSDVTRRPQLLRQRLLRGFERGQLRDRSGFPRGWSLPSA